MASLGQRLREARERQGLSLEEIEASTRIRKSYLIAIEDEDYGSLPHPTYVKGFLKTYAIRLGIDPAEILELYPLRDARPTLTPVAKLEKPRVGGGFWVAALLLLIAVAGLAAYLYSASLTIPNIETGISPAAVTDEVAPTIPPVSEALSSSTLEATATAQAAVPPTATPTPQAVEVKAQATANSWVSVTVDSAPTFTGTMHPGEEHTWTGKDKIVMRIGNAGGLSITYNGQPRGVLGSNGQVLDVQWTRDSMSFDVNAPAPTSTPGSH